MNDKFISKIKELQNTDTDESYQNGLWDIAFEMQNRHNMDGEKIYQILQDFFDRNFV